jgi:predicted Zn finger-like uncharacterized protein
MGKLQVLTRGISQSDQHTLRPMIISCPSCFARHNLPDNRFSGESMAITCTSCGHGWIESRAVEVYDVSPRTQRNLPVVIEPAYEPDTDVKKMLDASRQAQEAFAAKRRKRLKRLRGWAILGACVAAPLAAAAAFPSTVVSLAPVTIRAYDAAGIPVNIFGLEVRRVEQQHAIVDGTRVLTIKGEVTNISGSAKKMPWLRFGLLDGASQDVYHWTLDTGARPLRPGETTSFVTRVASPPESAKNLQIRFAHADEISSKP